MIKRQEMDMAEVEQLVINWNEMKPNARNELVSYIEPWFKDYSSISFVENKSSINTSMKLLGSPKDLAQEVAKKLTEKFPMPSLKITEHKKFDSAEDLIIYIRVLMLNQIEAKAEKLTRNKNTLHGRERVLSIPESELGDDMANYDIILSFGKLYKELAVKYRKKLLAYDLKVFHGHTLDEVSMIMGVSLSTVKNYIKHIELKVLDRLKL